MAAITDVTSPLVINTGTTLLACSIELSSSKSILAYVDASDAERITLRVGTEVGGSVVFGDEYKIDGLAGNTPSLCRINDTQFLYCATVSQDLQIRVCTVNGTTITIGDAYIVHTYPLSVANSARNMVMMTSSVFVVTYIDMDDNKKGLAKIGTISGDTISFSSEYVFDSSEVWYRTTPVRISDTKFVINYIGSSPTMAGRCKVGNIVGNTLTFGSTYTFHSTKVLNIYSFILDSSRFITFYIDDDGKPTTAVIGTVSGDTLSFGTKSVHTGEYNGGMSISKLDDNNFLIAMRHALPSDRGAVLVAVLSEGLITYGSMTEFNNGGPIADIAISKVGNALAGLVYRDNDPEALAVTVSFSGVAALNPLLVSLVYNISSVKGNLRGKGTEGFIRPTLSQFFTSKDFHDVPSIAEATGGTITDIVDNGVNYRVHTFTEHGIFTPIKNLSEVEYLVVAGGGGSVGDSSGYGAGGGGAGGFRAATGFGVTTQAYPIIVGAGGAGSVNGPGNNGQNSAFSTILSTGGGAGGFYKTGLKNGIAGGSGGGGACGPGTGGVGIGGQGNNGGSGTVSYTATYAGGGGGGAGSVGGNASSDLGGGDGGAGKASSITGSSVMYAGGGGGGAGSAGNGVGGTGGTGGGGNGALYETNPTTAGIANTGGGAGGGAAPGTYGERDGGSGIVIVRYRK